MYLKPPKEMGLPDDFVLLAIKPIYGVPESGLHWFVTYQGHHCTRLGMKETRIDPCLLYLRKGSTVHAVTALQVDDNLGHGDAEFLADEEKYSELFESKPRLIFQSGTSTTFNGATITMLDDESYAMHQNGKLLAMTEATIQDELILIRAKLQYIGSCTRPDLCAPVQMMATEVLRPSKETYKRMRAIVRWAHDTSQFMLKFVRLDHATLQLLLFTDASFATTEGQNSRIGFVLVLADADGEGKFG